MNNLSKISNATAPSVQTAINAFNERFLSEPLLKHMTTQITHFLTRIKNNDVFTKMPMLLVVNGGDGIGKTNFIARHLQDFLYEHNIIKTKMEKVIKVSDRDLSMLKNIDEVENKIENCFHAAKGNILIITDFHKGNPHTTKIVNAIQQCMNDATFANTVFVLNGTFENNKDILLRNGLKYSMTSYLNFITPSIAQLVNIFSEYLFKKSEVVLKDDAKKTVWIYFKKLQWLKDMRTKQDPIFSRYNKRQTTFMFANELLHLHTAIIESINTTKQFILDSHDVVKTPVYQKLLVDTQTMQQKFCASLN